MFFVQHSFSKFITNKLNLCVSVMCLCCLLVANNISAQVATMDGVKVMATMPIFAKSDTLLQEESKKYTQEYNQKKQNAQNLYSKADSLKKVKPKEEIYAAAVQAANAAITDFQQYEKQVQDKLQEYKSLLLTPYYEKIDKAIRAVATKLKYKQVLDINKVSFLYLDKTADITEEVIKQLSE